MDAQYLLQVSGQCDNEVALGTRRVHDRVPTVQRHSRILLLASNSLASIAHLTVIPTTGRLDCYSPL